MIDNEYTKTCWIECYIYILLFSLSSLCLFLSFFLSVFLLIYVYISFSIYKLQRTAENIGEAILSSIEYFVCAACVITY